MQESEEHDSRTLPDTVLSQPMLQPTMSAQTYYVGT